MNDTFVSRTFLKLACFFRWNLIIEYDDALRLVDPRRIFRDKNGRSCLLVHQIFESGSPCPLSADYGFRQFKVNKITSLSLELFYQD